MVTNLNNLSEAVNRAADAADRRLAEEIDQRFSTIKHDLEANGYSEIEFDGKMFKISRSSGQE